MLELYWCCQSCRAGFSFNIEVFSGFGNWRGHIIKTNHFYLCYLSVCKRWHGWGFVSRTALRKYRYGYRARDLVNHCRKYRMLSSMHLVLSRQNTPMHQPSTTESRLVYSFGIPALRLSYLLCGYSKQFWLISMCLPPYPPSPCTVILTKLSALEPGWSPESSHHMPPPRPVFLM